MIIVAEDHPENFLPLTLTRATFELRYGALSPLDRALLEDPDVVLLCRPELADYLRAKTGLPVNEEWQGTRPDAGVQQWPGLPEPTPWGILTRSSQLITDDFEMWSRHNRNWARSRVARGVHVIGDLRHIHIGLRTVVQPGCVLDVSAGPIIIADGAVVKWSQIQGPVFVGKGCIIDGARLRPGTSLGPNCKVGGEVSASIFQSRVNKGHEGFVGNSWAGRWVNFGAGATTSNLKNTYGNIRFPTAGETVVDTGVQFLGSLIGDHTKLGIGQMLTTGSHIGTCCNVFGAGVAPKYIPSFSWGGAAGWQEYELEACLGTVRATLARRQARLRPQSEQVLRRVFAASADDRGGFAGERPR